MKNKLFLFIMIILYFGFFGFAGNTEAHSWNSFRNDDQIDHNQFTVGFNQKFDWSRQFSGGNNDRIDFNGFINVSDHKFDWSGSFMNRNDDRTAFFNPRKERFDFNSHNDRNNKWTNNW